LRKVRAKRTRKREFLDEMDLVIPWSELLALIAPHAPAGKTGRPPFATEVMLRIHLLQQFFGHSDPAMEEALHDIPLYREFARLDAGITRLPDESTILRFPTARRAPAQPADTGHRQQHAGRQRPAAQDRHRRRRHLDCSTELDQERAKANATPRCTRPRRATSGTLA
jgi:hypothetical protein